MGTILEPKLLSQDHHQAQMPRDFITGLLHVPHHEQVIMPKQSTLNDLQTRAPRAFPIMRATTSFNHIIYFINDFIVTLSSHVSLPHETNVEIEHHGILDSLQPPFASMDPFMMRSKNIIIVSVVLR